MWQKIKDNWKTYLLLILSALFGADKALEYASAGPEFPVNQPRTEKPAQDVPDAAPGMFVVQASFYIPNGGGAFPAGKDYIGAYVFEVLKPRPDLILSAFLEQYGEVFPAAEVGRIHTLKIPDKGAEPAPDEPDEK